jgi:hypothetical protein
MYMSAEKHDIIDYINCAAPRSDGPCGRASSKCSHSQRRGPLILEACIRFVGLHGGQKTIDIGS